MDFTVTFKTADGAGLDGSIFQTKVAFRVSAKVKMKVPYCK